MTIRCQLKTTVDMARNIHLIMITISTSVIIKISRIVIVMLWILRRSCAVRREWRPTAQIIFPVSTSGQGEEAIVIITAITYIFSVTYSLHFFNSRKSEFTRWFDYWSTFSISLQKWIELHFWFTFLKSLERLKCMRELVYFSKKSRKVKMYVRSLKRVDRRLHDPR